MADEKTYVFDGASRNDIPLAYALNNGNGFGNGLGGWGGGILGFILGALVSGGFGSWGGWGGNGFGGGVGNMLNNDNNTDVLLQAINGTDSDVRLLATTLNADVNEVRSAISDVRLGLSNVGSQVGMSGLQVINAIQSGDAALSRQLCESCYNNQIATLEQTNALSGAISFNGQRTVDAIADLKTTMTREFCEVREREMTDKIATQAEIISQLRGQIDNANQTAAITGYINSVITPLQREVDKISENQPSTVSVQYPNLVAVNTTPYTGGYYGGYPYYGNGSIWA